MFFMLYTKLTSDLGRAMKKEIGKNGLNLEESADVSKGASRRALVLGLTTFSAAMMAQASERAKAGDFWRIIYNPTPTPNPNCYLQGTMIATPAGEVGVETLKVGDFVVTHDGRREAVKWVGHKTVAGNGNKRWDYRMAPICFKRGSLADGVPHTDLYVSRAHCFLINGLLVPAATLVNGRSIVVCRDYDAPELKYFHMELEGHNVIIANGAPAETLLPGSEMERFDGAFDTTPTELRPYAPIVGTQGAGKKIASFARSFIAPWRDTRKPIDRIRDELYCRAVWNWAA
jgi:Hint domain